MEPAYGGHRKTLPIDQPSWPDRRTGGLRQEPLPPGPPARPRPVRAGAEPLSPAFVALARL